MKTTLISLFLASAGVSAFAFTATFQDNDTDYLWTDASIWDTVPNASGNVIIRGNGTTGSSLNLDALDLSAWKLNTELNDAVLNVTNGSKYFAGDSRTAIVLKGASLFNLNASDLQFGTFNKVTASGTSVFRLANGSTFSAGSYMYFDFSGNSKFEIDATAYSKNTWGDGDQFFSENAQLNISNKGALTTIGRHSSDNFTFKDDAQINLTTGGSFNVNNNAAVALNLTDRAIANASSTNSDISKFYLTGGLKMSGSASMILGNNSSLTVATNATTMDGTSSILVNAETGFSALAGFASALTLNDYAKITTDGATSTFTSGNPLTMNGNSELVFKNGAIVNLNSTVTLSDSAKITYDAVAPAQAVLEKIALTSADSSVSIKNATVNMSGAFTTQNAGVINFDAGSKLNRTGATLVLGGTTKISMNAGSSFAGGGWKTLEVADDSVLTFNGITDWTLNGYGRFTASGNGIVNFTNGMTGGGYVSGDFTGNSKVNISGTGTALSFTSFYDNSSGSWAPADFTFSGTSAFSISDRALFQSNGQHTQEGYIRQSNIVLKDSASMSVASGATVNYYYYSNSMYQGLRMEGASTANFSGEAGKLTNVKFGMIVAEAAGNTASIDLEKYATLEVVDSITLKEGSSLNVKGGTLKFGSMALADNAKLSIQGSDSNVGSTTSAFAATGGTIEFIADENGISKLVLSTIADFDVQIFLDFENYNLLNGDTLELISSAADWQAKAEAFIASSNWNRTDSLGNTYDLSYDNKSLFLTITEVPEPATYAAILGALAMGIAIYRRRK